MARGFADFPQNINRRGRPRKGKTLTDALEKYVASKNEAGERRGEVLARTLFDLALAGDVAALRYIYDRIDGRPTQRIEAEAAVIPAETRTVLRSFLDGGASGAPGSEGETR
jgi:hypothetical protein